MRKALIISLATGTLLLAGCQRDEPAEEEATADAEALPADEGAADSPADADEADEAGEEAE